ncbi:MAG: polysaccharide lyase family 8 super-sandwich domain-containing protein [Verrucomicrobiota bacterium]
MRKCVVLLMGLVSLGSYSSDLLAYVPQPYTPVSNTPAELVAKQSALNVLRSEWSGDDYTQSGVFNILSGKGLSDPTTAPGRFNADGSWHLSLPSGPTLTSGQYATHEDYAVDLLALAYLHAYQGQSTKQLIYDSLAWYFDNGFAAPHEYHETFNYHAAQNTIGGIMLIMGQLIYDDIHADRVSDTQAEGVFQNLRQYLRAFINAAPQIRGVNWTFRMHNALLYVLFTNEVEDMDEYSYHWNQAVSFNRWQGESDGIHADWSMMHHGDMNYWGMYGLSWISDTIDYGEVLAGTPWAYETEQLDFIADALIEGARWSLYRGVCDYSTAGKRATRLLDRTDANADNLLDSLSELINLGGSKLTRRHELMQIKANYLHPPWTTAGAAQSAQPEFAGHRYFWNTEYQVHRRSNYGIYVRRCSQRVRPPEDRTASGSQAFIHLNYGTGFTPILRRGDEIRFSRLAWDFERVPGVTTELGNIISSGGAGSTRRGYNLFSGGVTDGHYGFGAFEMNIVGFNSNNSGNFDYINGAAAVKGTFFFDDYMLALGQQVRRVATVNGSQNTILTTLNNVRRLTDVVYSIDGGSEVTVAPGTSLQQEFAVTSKAWVWHDGMGYVIWPSASPTTELVFSLGDIPFNDVVDDDPDMQARIRQELGDAAWEAGAMNMFQLWLDHGQNPSNDTYAYAVLPDCTLAELRSFAQTSPVAFVNSGGLQTVDDVGAQIYYASFQQAGTATFSDGKTFNADRPLMLMANGQSGSFAYTAANPVHRGLRRSYVPGSGETVGELVIEPVTVGASGFSGNEQLYFTLLTERGMEGASVPGSRVARSRPEQVVLDWEFDSNGPMEKDSGATATDWTVATATTATPGWTVTQSSVSSGDALVVEPDNNRLVLSGFSSTTDMVSEALLPFSGEQETGSLSTRLALDSANTWTGARFNLVHVNGSTVTTLIEFRIQRNGSNSNNLITSGNRSLSLNGQWEDTFNEIEISWDRGIADLLIKGLDTGNIYSEGNTFQADLTPNALLIQVDATADSKMRKLVLDQLTIRHPSSGFADWEFDDLAMDGSDSGQSDTLWNRTTPEMADPAWAVIELGNSADSSLEVEPENSRMFLNGRTSSSNGVSRAVLPFGQEREDGSISARVGLDSGSTWTGAKFSLVNMSGGEVRSLIDLNIQRDGNNANNLLTTGNQQVSLNGSWEDVLNTIEFKWYQGLVDVSVTGLAGGDIHLTGQSMLQDLTPNALLIQAGSNSDNRARKLVLGQLKVVFLPVGYSAWMQSFGISGGSQASQNNDFDLDGFDNQSEYLAGSSPTARSSYPRLQNRINESAPNEYLLQWDSLDGRLYDLYHSTDMQLFMIYREGMRHPVSEFVVPWSELGDKAFFRLKIRPE